MAAIVLVTVAGSSSFLSPAALDNGVASAFREALDVPTILRDAQLAGSSLNLSSPYFQLFMSGPSITSFRTDGTGTGNYGSNWLH